MGELFKISEWNANGLCQHSQELRTFVQNNNIDIMLVAETHCTNKSYLKIPGYIVYHTEHPDGTAHGGTAIIVKRNIKHHLMEEYKKEYLQATTICVDQHTQPMIISATYCPPKHNNKKENYEKYLKTLGNRYIAGGDWNAKHTQWGSRVITTKGRELLAAIIANKATYLSTGQPTYWPSDPRKHPDLIDFWIIKGINKNYFQVKSSLDLSSDHSPIIASLFTTVVENIKQPSLYNCKTNWENFRDNIDKNINLKISLKTPQEIDLAVSQFIMAIQKAAWAATPSKENTKNVNNIPITVKEKIAEKRQLRKRWQNSRCVSDKTKLNKATKDLTRLLREIKNKGIQEYLASLTSTKDTDYSLWKATKKLKQPQQYCPPVKDIHGKWARNNREKAIAFADHLVKVFEPNEEDPNTDYNEIRNYLDSPIQMELPIKNFSLSEVKNTIMENINPKKAPGYDLITGKVLQELSVTGFKLLQLLYNAVLRVGYYPCQWKVSQIILIPKAGKKPEELNSYRPISLLPVLSKAFEKLLLRRLTPILESRKLIPDHQFGFRSAHGTIEQVHRIVKKISLALERKSYLSAAFLDVSQAFDKVWHEGLIYKIKRQLPHSFLPILKSYLSDRHFSVKQQDEITGLYSIKSGVPQGSVLGPTLYLLFTSDLPASSYTEIATFADDTAVLALHHNPATASRYLQDNLNKIEKWLKKWRIKANEAKSTHITYTMKRDTCPPVTLNGTQLAQLNDTKYLGIHLDRRLTWQKHIFAKRKQLGIKFKQMYWMIGRKSELTLENKLLLYKAILKPTWTYGIQLWGSASNSNLEILQRFQNKVLRVIVDAPWYVTSASIEKDLQVPSIKEVIKSCSSRYGDRVSAHPNILAKRLFDNTGEVRRLKRFKPDDLVNRFT